MASSTPGAATVVSNVQLVAGPTVYNSDVAGIVNRMNDFLDELLASVSANSNYFNTSDSTRFNSYLSAILNYVAWVTAQPQLDLPKTSPRGIPLVDYPVITTVNNNDLDDMIRLFAISRDELTNSQSALDGSGLIAFDANRLIAIVTKMQNFMANYVAKTNPVDLPASQPLNPTTGAAATTATNTVQ